MEAVEEDTVSNRLFYYGYFFSIFISRKQNMSISERNLSLYEPETSVGAERSVPLEQGSLHIFARG